MPGWEETENEIRYRVQDPKDFADGSFFVKEFQKDPRIYAVMGTKKGEDASSIQAMRFDKVDWQLEDAQKWYEDHKESIKKCCESTGIWIETGGEIQYQANNPELFESRYGDSDSWETREIYDAGAVIYAEMGQLLGKGEKRISKLIFPKAVWTAQKARNYVDKNVFAILSGEIAKSGVAKSVEPDVVQLYKQANLEPQAFSFMTPYFSEEQVKSWLVQKSLDVAGLKKSADKWQIEVRSEVQFQKGSLRDIQVRDGLYMTVGLLKKEFIQKRVPDRFALPASMLNYLEELDLNEVTLTKAPAVGKMAEFTIIKSLDTAAPTYSKTTPILKVDSARRQVGGYVLVPDLPDWQGDIVSKEEVEKAAHRFMKNLAMRNQTGSGTGLEHHSFDGIGYPIESFIDYDGVHGVPNAWFLKTQITQDDTWEAVKKGQIVGYSVGGNGKRRKATLDVNVGKSSDFSPEEMGFFRKLFTWFTGKQQAPAAQTPVIIKTQEPNEPTLAQPQTQVQTTQQIQDVKKGEDMIIEIKKCYSEEEIQKAKEAGVDLEKATEGITTFLKAVGMNFDWRGVGAMTLTFIDAARNGEFGMIPGTEDNAVLKSQEGNEQDALAAIQQQMMVMQQQIQEMQAGRRGVRKSSAQVPIFASQPAVEDYGWDGGIDFSSKKAGAILANEGEI